MCCMQEVIWRRKGTRMKGMNGRRYNCGVLEEMELVVWESL